MADEGLFAGQAEPARAGAGGDDQRPRVNLAGRGFQLERMRVRSTEFRCASWNVGAEPRGLLLHVFDQFRSLDAFGPAGKVLHQGGDRKLSAGLVAFQNQRLQTGARGVDRRGEAGAAGAEDYGIASVCHVRFPVLIVDGRACHPVRARSRYRTGFPQFHNPMYKMTDMANLTLDVRNATAARGRSDGDSRRDAEAGKRARSARHHARAGGIARGDREAAQAEPRCVLRFLSGNLSRARILSRARRCAPSSSSRFMPGAATLRLTRRLSSA